MDNAQTIDQSQPTKVVNQDPSEYTPKGNSAAFTITEPSTPDEMQAIIDDMAAYFATGITKDVKYRLAQLTLMYNWLKIHEDEVLDALHADLGKHPQEGYETELGLVLDEISTAVKHLRRWAAPKIKKTPITLIPSSTKVYAQPYGVAAIMAPWNYPIQLSLVPLVDALAAGNVAFLKPSKTSPNSGKIIQRMCREVFDPRYVYCVFDTPNLDDNMEKIKVDFMFFTGSARVGKIVMGACAENLTPLVLELGGKSPVFIDKNADLRRAGERIAWGKCLNSGQTCVGPDYILCHEDVVDEFVEYFAHYVRKYFGKDILKNDQYPHMISKHHFDRVCGLIDNRNPNSKIAYGGGRDASTLRIEPTVLTGITLDDPVMNQEIFGPALPIITWNKIEDAVAVTENFGHPLACYIFSNDRAFQQHIIHTIPYGGGCINDVVVHVSTNEAGFGGFGASGMGEYHGKHGFDAFTHYKTVVHKYNIFELPLRSAPYLKWKFDIVKFLLK